MYCCPLWFNCTSTSIKNRKSSNNLGIWVLGRLLYIHIPYSASEMFVSCDILSFYALLRKCIFDFSERISKNTHSIIEPCLSPKVYIFLPLDNGGVQYYFNYKLFHAYYFIVIS